MNFFWQLKPRRFHHEYMFVDERKERLGKMKERIEKEIQQENAEGTPNADDYQPSIRFKRKRRNRLGNTPLYIIGVGILFLLSVIFLFLELM